jgi:hypothetical protein
MKAVYWVVQLVLMDVLRVELKAEMRVVERVVQ